MRRESGKVYRPSDKEPLMSERQREYFRQRLLAWREEILKEARDTLQHLQDENQNNPDLADRAARPHRGRHLRLLRGNRRTDFAASPGSASHRDLVDRGAGAPRAPRAGVSGRLGRARATLAPCNNSPTSSGKPARPRGYKEGRCRRGRRRFARATRGAAV